MEESYIWCCLLEDYLLSLTNISNVSDYVDVLIKSLPLIQDVSPDQMEAVRGMLHSLLKFIVCTIEICEKGLDIERQILRRQLRHLLPEVSFDPSAVKYYRDLTDVFIEFWNKKCDIITKIRSKMSPPDMNEIENEVMDVVLVVLDKNAKIEQLLEFFNVYNSFLERLDAVSFDWLIQAIPGVDMQNLLSIELISQVFPQSASNNRKQSGLNYHAYQVTDPEKFVQMLPVLHRKAEIPAHKIALVVKKQLALILFQLKRNQWSSGLDISKSDQIATTATLISVVAERLPNLNNQWKYDSNESFVAANVKYLSYAVNDSSSTDDFESRIRFKDMFIKNIFYLFIILLVLGLSIGRIWLNEIFGKKPDNYNVR
ncbi:uncharacterized protein LOC131425975 [Malaya genurostris]|uniref:uncharacterized protein LOC131425975 n=1 Tax=Malaya genurostris TaxID=325434 RepID=UPI0026F3EC14|nr:uncharacterized protein LOC131425975 [Malaya genurostris]